MPSRRSFAWCRLRSRCSGAFNFGLEAAHSHQRILHARGDTTGREIMRALVAAPSNGNDYGARGSRSPSHHSCDVRYLASVPGVQGGSEIRRELRWPVKYDQSHWRCTRSRFCSCGRERM